jgi:hypothetical protein
LKVNRSKNKNLSISEHVSLIEKKYNKLSRQNFRIKEFNIVKEYPSFTNNIHYYIPLYSVNNAPTFIDSKLILNASFIKFIFTDNLLEYGFSELLRLRLINGDLFIISDIHEISIIIDKKFIEKNILENNEELFFNTDILYVNFLNIKTINHFSKLIFIENQNIYLLQRKDWFSLFVLKI